MNNKAGAEWKGWPLLVSYIAGLALSVAAAPMTNDIPYLTGGYLVYGLLLLTRFIIARRRHERNRRYIAYCVLSVILPFLCLALTAALDALVK